MAPILELCRADARRTCFLGGGRRGARARRRRGGVGAAAPHRADHERRRSSTSGAGRCRRSRNFHPGPILLVEAAAGGLAVSLLALWAPVIRGHGIPEAMEAVLTRQSRIAPRAAVAKPLSAAIAIGTGGPFGAEGPIIVTGGALGSLIGQLIRVTPVGTQDPPGVRRRRGHVRDVRRAARRGRARDRAAALRVLAPRLRAARRRVERRGRDARGACSAPVRCSTSRRTTTPASSSLPVFAVVGIACGLLAVVICKGLYLVEGGFRRLPISEFWHPILGALGFAVRRARRAPGARRRLRRDQRRARRTGSRSGRSRRCWSRKLVAWWVALGSGTSGGTLAPILLISGAFGGLLGALINHIAPGLHLSPGAVALVAMAATFGAATRATFTAIVFAFELTRDYHAILADHARRRHRRPRRRRAARPRPHDREARPARAARPARLPARLSPGHARRAPRWPPTSSVLDAGDTVGDARRQHRTELATAPTRSSTTTGAASASSRAAISSDPTPPPTRRCRSIASADVVTVAPDDTLLTALERIIDEEVEHLPVVDDGAPHRRDVHPHRHPARPRRAPHRRTDANPAGTRPGDNDAPRRT